MLRLRRRDGLCYQSIKGRIWAHVMVGISGQPRISLVTFDALFTLLKPRAPLHVQYADVFRHTSLGSLNPDDIKSSFKQGRYDTLQNAFLPHSLSLRIKIEFIPRGCTLLLLSLLLFLLIVVKSYNQDKHRRAFSATFASFYTCIC